jgi:predicted nucleotidyltransferase
MRREQVVAVLREALEPLAHVNAAWLGGSDAFGRADELSDVDLQVDVDDGHVAATFGAVEAALAAASPIVARLVMPMPTWHGHAQRFYRLRDTSEFTAVDVVVFERSDPRRYYNQTERHGRPLVLFDRAGVIRPVALDPAELAAALRRETARIRERLPFTLPQVAKEVRRGDALAALGSWHRYVLAPLVTCYRIRHAPARHDFGLRYTADDLPAEVQATLRELSFVRDLDDLAAKLPEAERLLRRLLAELEEAGRP